ncbi:IS66 family insertion sequence element accessory protein TnpB [Microbulbifer sp. ZKSA006]|uniref:IS66 family insertion sequence element accessory protein TnpB n=1 Tax=Microbulbifer sp. ZKSA006 TaxID=3243390 RepID=UPI004039DA72
MLRPKQSAQAYLYMEPVDMRKSIDGLAALVEQEMALSPALEALFVFCNRNRDKIKLLYWERNGFVVWYKRLEKQRFHWMWADEITHTARSGRELNQLLDGLNIWSQKPHQLIQFDSIT